ncbi:MAG: SDR family NAD(P)-dependent oxidoreductase [Streptococcaceae bacterium]|jgi:uncharacterized oxidoreductase|nr:SDR family NAD(P)-dependent oxidoreductase [Streptococcaceae bacterium]
MVKFTGHTILITGGTSGIGLGFAKAFAELGNQVIITARNAARLADVLAENPSFAGFTSDVNDAASLVALRDKVATQFPKLDVLFNSAGIMRAYNLFDENVAAEEMLAEITTNLNGTILATKTFLPLITRNAGTIINVSSGLANFASGAHPIYSATKAGVHMFTNALREQALYFEKPIRVIELVPPLVAETNLEASVSVDAPNNLKLSDLVAQGIAGIETGSERIDAGFAEQMHQMAKDDEEGLTRRMAQGMLAGAFPKG